MFCNKCGHQVNPNDQFCVKCGEPLRNLKQRVQNNQSRQTPPRVQPSAQRQGPPPQPSAQRQAPPPQSSAQRQGPPPGNYGPNARYMRPTPPPAAPVKKKKSAFPFVIGGALAMCVVVCIVAIVFLLGGRSSSETAGGTGDHGKAENPFEAYIVNYLMPTAGVFRSTKEWEASLYNGNTTDYELTHHLDGSGLLFTEIIDLDKDGDDELLVARMLDPASESHNIILAVYEKTGHTVRLADEILWQPYMEGVDYSQTPTDFESAPVIERTLVFSLIEQKDSYAIFNEYRLGGEIALDMPTQVYWALKYNGEKLQYTSSFIKNEIGTDTADFLGFEFSEGKETGSNIVIGTNDDFSEFGDRVAQYFGQHDISIDGSKISLEGTIQDESVLKPSDDIKQMCKIHIYPKPIGSDLYKMKYTLTDSTILHQKFGRIDSAYTPYQVIVGYGVVNGTEFISTPMAEVENPENDYHRINYKIRRGNKEWKIYGVQDTLLTNGDIVYYATRKSTAANSQKTDSSTEYQSDIRRLDLNFADNADDAKYICGTVSENGIDFLGYSSSTSRLYFQPQLTSKQSADAQEYESRIICYDSYNSKESYRENTHCPVDYYYGDALIALSWEEYACYSENGVLYLYDCDSNKKITLSDKQRSGLDRVGNYIYYVESTDKESDLNIIKHNLKDVSDKKIVGEIRDFEHGSELHFNHECVHYAVNRGREGRDYYIDDPCVDLKSFEYKFTGPESDEAESTSQGTTTDTDHKDSADTTEAPHAKLIDMTDIMSAYNDAMQSFYADSYLFGLVYIDDDDIPELILSAGDSHGNKPQVYTYKDGQTVLFDNFGSHFGEFNYVPRKGLVAECLFGNGGYITTNIHKLENGTASDVIQFYNTDEISRDGESYQVNGQETTNEDYYNQVDENISSQGYKVLRHADLPGYSEDDSLNGDNYQDYVIEGINDSTFDDLNSNRY